MEKQKKRLGIFETDVCGNPDWAHISAAVQSHS